MKRSSSVLLLLVLLLAAGRFLPGPRFWGINHLAYLPLPIFLGWLVCATVLLLPPIQSLLAEQLRTRLPGIFRTPLGGLGLTVLATGLFALFRERSFFMGDGYLVGELVERGMKFRAFDNMDYQLHYQIYRALHGQASSFTVYRVGSVLAGALGTFLLWWLVRKLPWEGWRRVLVLGFFLLTGPVAMFHGYVESYSWLFLFLSGFLVAGVLVLEGVVGIWLPSALFGAALFFHLTAVFSGPALLYLALCAPVRPSWRRWVDVTVPALILFLISVILHLAAGYNSAWFRREFLESQNARSLWVPLLGSRGLFSLYHWKDLANLLLITVPGAVAVVVLRLQALRSRAVDRRVQFLLVQIASIVFFAVGLDKKLGGARDWDLLAAHSLGVGLLAALWIAPFPERPEPGKPRTANAPDGSADSGAVRSAALALTVSFLVAAPWISVLHLERASIARFVDVAADFPDFARAYAYEEVGKYYRKAEDYDRAEVMYRRCVETYPGNPRFHVLLGSIFMIQASRTDDDERETHLLDQAEAEYRQALQSMPDNPLALGNLAQALASRGKLDEALPIYEKLVVVDPGKDVNWIGLGNVRLQIGDPTGAVAAYGAALQRNPAAPVKDVLGAALLGSGRFPEAAAAFSECLRAGNRDPRVLFGLASARVGEAEQTRREGKVPDARGLYEAETVLRELLQKDPQSQPARDLLGRLQQLKAGVPGS
ncbi:MAG: tetratricopeptide repeat protein [Candidatus Eisenbacteria bacterium]|uniref:Tetratricopeptide repeat protein n=1 Tax=Eiseniibacteriota bacterium TaxID=2212470 RepID=A0A956LWF0_UNCEI|nr:tetratricopeptide repeat protein [Candidatus Eisenbacteria bacterium]